MARAVFMLQPRPRAGFVRREKVAAEDGSLTEPLETPWGEFQGPSWM